VFEAIPPVILFTAQKVVPVGLKTDSVQAVEVAGKNVTTVLTDEVPGPPAPGRPGGPAIPVFNVTLMVRVNVPLVNVVITAHRSVTPVNDRVVKLGVVAVPAAVGHVIWLSPDSKKLAVPANVPGS
jgi:hypothetical protein